MFGFPVSLYYLKQENQKKSSFGAMMTIFLAIMSISMMAVLVKQLRNPDYQQLSQTEFTIDLSELPETSFKDDSFRMFYVVRRPQGFTK